MKSLNSMPACNTNVDRYFVKIIKYIKSCLGLLINTDFGANIKVHSYNTEHAIGYNSPCLCPYVRDDDINVFNKKVAGLPVQRFSLWGRGNRVHLGGGEPSVGDHYLHINGIIFWGRVAKQQASRKPWVDLCLLLLIIFLGVAGCY